MAVVTWDGSSSTAWTTGANWDTGSVPTSSDDVLIPNVSNDPVIADGTNPEVKTIELAASATLTCGNNTITVNDETSQYAFKGIGTLIPQTSTIVVTTDADTLIKCENGSFNNLTINPDGGDNTVTLYSDITVGGNLTITGGTLDTNSSSNYDLTVTKDVLIGTGSGTGDSAVLIGNASEIIINGGMKIDVTGKYDATTHANGTVINKHLDSSVHGGIYALWLIAGGTFIHNDGLVHVTGTGGYSLVIEGLSGSDVSGTNANALHDLKVTLNSISNFVKLDPVPSSNGDTMVITGDLDIVEGKVHGNSTSDNLTVNGNVIVRDGAQLSESTQVSGAMTFGSLTIESGGTYIATSGTTTITGTSNADWNWTNNGTFTHNKGKVKFFTDSTSMEMWISNGDTFYDLEIDSADPSGVYYHNNIIYGDLTVTDGPFHAYTHSTTLTVHGNTFIGSEGQLVNGAAQSGTLTFHGLVTNEGTLHTSSGTNNFNGGVRNLATMASDDTLTIGGTGGILEGNLDDAIVNVNLDAALDFNGDGGTDDYVTLTEGSGAPTIAADGAFTISAWIKPAFTSGSKYVAGEGHSGGSSTDTDRFGIIVNSSTIAISMYINNGDDVSSYVTVDVDKWNHIAFTRAASSTTGRYYINGVAAGTDTVDNANWVLGKIGGYGNNSSNRWQGHIADVKLYNSDLSTDGADLTPIQALASKINIHYSQVGTGTQPLSWFKLNDGTGNPADSGSSGNATVRTNATWDLGGPTDDPFSVDVYDNSTTTDGNFTITKGKVEGLALSYVHNDETNDATLSANEAAAIDDLTALTKGTFACWTRADNWSATSDDDHWIYSLSDATDDYFFVVHMDDSSGTTAKVRTALFENGAYQWEVSTDSRVCSLDTWHHIAVTQDGSGPAIYVDGVKPAQTFTNSTDTAAWWDELHGIGADRNMMGGGFHYNNNAHQYEPDGDFRDFRFYNYALSADQMSSLYSGSYNVTPMHWIKCDEGSGTLADSGTDTAWNVTNTSLTYVNGTLNLDGTLTIEDDGTLSAPRGNLDLANVAFAKNASGTFTHNKGNVKFSTAGGSSITTSDPVLYDLELNCGGSNVDVTTDLTIEHDLTVTSGALRPQPNTKGSELTVTFGTDSSHANGAHASQLELDSYGIGMYVNTTHACVLTGASSLYPFKVLNSSSFGIDMDAGGSGSKLKLANMDYDKDLTTGGNGVTITLTGDCEFNAVTVSGGDTLDVDGQRVYSSGTVDINGYLKMGAGMWHAGGNFDTSNAAVTEEEGATFLLEGDNYIHNNDGSFAGDANTNILLQGTKSTYLNSFESGGYAHYVGNLIVGSGTATLPGPDRSGVLRGKANNITVASGATLTPSGAQEVICLGDFTTSGGLLGASCLELNGSSEYAATAVFYDDRSVNNSADYTIELWFRRTETSGTETLFDFAHWDGDAYTGQSRTSAYMDAAGIIYWDTRTGGGTLNARPQSSAGFDDSKWHHAAFVFKGVSGAHAGTYSTGAKEIWIDGKLEARVLGGDTTTDAGSSVAGNMGYDQNKTMAFQVGRQVVSSIGNFFTGQIDEIRIWSDARTQAEIRDNMFTEVAATADHLRHQWSFNEGTGTTNAALDTATDAEGEAHVDNIHMTPSAAGAWAGAGTFTKGTSTVVFAKSGTQNLNFYNSDNFENITINAGSTVSLNGFGLTSGATIDLFGNLVVTGALTDSGDSSEMKLRTAGKTHDFSGTMTGLYKLGVSISSGDLNLPALNTKRLDLTSSSSVIATGNHTLTEELEVNSGTTYNANGNTIACKLVDVNGGTLDLRNSTLNFSVTSSGDEFNLHSSSTLTTGNTTITGNTSSNTPAYLSYGGDFEVVGDVSNLELQSNADLTVIGAVINCTFQSGVTNANIRQWHHTLDTQQLLDADENGDDDLRLTKPALDNALELMTK